MRGFYGVRKKRFEDLRKRKNFLPSVVLTLILWLIVASVVIFLAPESTFTLITFFTILFLALLFTFSLIFTHKRYGFWVASGVILFLLLRYFNVGTIINLLLIAGVICAFEFYFRRKA